jgi:hypothetical protein
MFSSFQGIFWGYVNTQLPSAVTETLIIAQVSQLRTERLGVREMQTAYLREGHTNSNQTSKASHYELLHEALT